METSAIEIGDEPLDVVLPPDPIQLAGACQFVTVRLSAKEYRHICTACGHTAITQTRFLTRTQCQKVIQRPQDTEEFKQRRAELDKLAAQQLANVPPPWYQRVANFAKASLSHLVEGTPTCTQDEIDRRWSLCKHCPKYIPQGDGAGLCSLCGCSLNPSPKKYISKLAWRDQSCPDNPPRWGPLT